MAYLPINKPLQEVPRLMMVTQLIHLHQSRWFLEKKKKKEKKEKKKKKKTSIRLKATATL